MRNLIFGILFLLSLFVIIGLAGTNDKQFEELITLKQLYNVQQEILENNFSKQEIDSMYFEYNYYYLNSYYKKNYK